MNRKRILALISALVLLAAPLSTRSVPRILAQTPGGWFDASWTYRRAASVSNPWGAAVADYQVRLTLGSAFDFGKAQPDGADLRVTAEDGQTPIPFWIEEWDPAGEYASIWVKVPSIPVSGSVVYLYYGNPGAAPAGDGDATFEFFDDDWDLPEHWGNPVHTIEGEGDWVTSYVSYPNVFREGDTYYMLYDGHTPHQKGLATSSDLITWTSLQDPVVLASGISGAWDETGVAWGDTIKVGSTYYMLVAGLSGSRWTIGVETSTDLATWDRAPAGATNPVLVASEAWEGGSGGSVSGTSVLKELDGITPVLHSDGNYWMAYHDYSSPYQIGLAYASDPLGPWTKYVGNPILSPTEPWESQGLWVTSFVEHEGTYYIFYYGRVSGGNFHMGYAWSDAATEFPSIWHKTTDPVLEYGDPGSWDDNDHEDPIIREYDGTFYLFYTGKGSVYANGFATAPAITGPFTKYEGGTPGSWIAGGEPQVTDGVLSLSEGDWIESPAAFAPGHAMGYRANYRGSANLYKWAGFITGHVPPFTYIGIAADYPPAPNEGNLILTNYITTRGYADLGPVEDAYHIYEVGWLADQTRASVDHSLAATVAAQVPQDPLPVQFQNYGDDQYSLDVDWVYVRQLRESEPEVVVGAEAVYTESPVWADAVVLVNSTSAHYGDFEHAIQPYLDNFGVPYTVHDIGTAPVTLDVLDRALIVIGHDGLDESGSYLDLTEQGYITATVSAGAGLVNFDSLLADAGHAPRYPYVQDILDLTYGPDGAASSIEIGQGGGGIRINCWEDDHQDPVLATTTNVSDLVEDDGLWTEFLYESSRPYPSLLAGADEEDHGLPVMRFYASGIPNGEYELLANLYTSSSGRDMRYYYGFTAGTPKAYSVDTVGGAGGSDQHEEYSLGTVTISDGTFELYVQDADLLGGTYPFFGWAWLRLVPQDAPPSALHYITARHEPDETIGLKSTMTALGMTPPADGEVVATASGEPYIVARSYGQGRAVQWGSYAFTQVGVKGYVYGLDDLVWRSLVWAARKPFVMQGMPPLLPMRVDDCSGPFGWAEQAADYGFRPWIGFFLHDLDATETDQLRTLVNDGDATTSIHAFTYNYFFYYNHGVGDYTDVEIAAHFTEGTQWHEDNQIPISDFVLGHFYELGTNAFDGLEGWGVEFVGMQMAPGTGYGSPWLQLGPYRRYESGSSSAGDPMYYADYLTVPGHPEHDGKFFNVVTEIRDNAGYEWYPSNDVSVSIERGVVQSRRAFDGMALATLFTHEQHVSGISSANWGAILQGVLDGLSEYEPVLVTMDDAVRYARAMVTSEISEAQFDAHAGVLTTTLAGETDLPTQFYLFTECGSEILEQRIDVPVFSGMSHVTTQLPGALHRVEISPAQVTLGFSDQQQFLAQGYDVHDVAVVCAEYGWSVVNDGGTVDEAGLFTAGTTPGTFTDTVAATDQGITGTATVIVSATPVHHFAFDPVSDQVRGSPFTVTITALDALDLPVIGYDGTAVLSDTTGSILPTVTGAFVDGTWSGEVTINQAAPSVTITVQDVGALGTSNPFTVTEPPPILAYVVALDSPNQTAGQPFTVTVSNVETTINLWEDDHQDPVLETFTDATLFDDTDGEWDEFDWTGRDYPGVFGGVAEATSGILEPMHFYASVPNGTYRVIANLYYSNDYRYFYGFDAGDMRAHSVDVTYGLADGFAEYDLGSVTITDSRFDLYTDYAEVIAGTAFPYFGWAWIRLEPALPEVAQFNLWEDDHQDPVLTTHSDAASLSTTDGQWDEFLYTAGRPYPTILAGADEEDYGLPVMHFYGAVPNGTYEVIANLYTSGPDRDMRYFYGFSPDDPEALYVDTVGGSGGAEQHTEVSLGIVTISDGQFDLYVRDAELLGGDYPYFGWAWVRLTSPQMAMSSSSPTMIFDGDGDGTFGEVGDEIGYLSGGTLEIAASDPTIADSVVISATDAAGFWGTTTLDLLGPTRLDVVSFSAGPTRDLRWIGAVLLALVTLIGLGALQALRRRE